MSVDYQSQPIPEEENDEMTHLLSKNHLAEKINIPTSYMDELLQAARLVSQEFDHHGLCHIALTKLGQQFGQYAGTQGYELSHLLNKASLKGQWVEFDIILWYPKVIPFLETLIEKDILDYACLNEYYKEIGDEHYLAGRALQIILEIRRPATLSFHELIAHLKQSSHYRYYRDSDDDIPF